MRNYKKTIIILLISTILIFSACSKSNIVYQPPMPMKTYGDNFTSELELKYTFDEIVLKTPKYYNALISSKYKFTITSTEPNYYGNISFSERNYKGSANKLDIDSYALFVTETSGTNIKVKFNTTGYYFISSRQGELSRMGVDFGIDFDLDSKSFIVDYRSSCAENTEKNVSINNLSIVEVDWSPKKDIVDQHLNIFAVVITKDEAIKYAQDGTLPKCLQGLTVKGLDEIFKKPD